MKSSNDYDTAKAEYSERVKKVKSRAQNEWGTHILPQAGYPSDRLDGKRGYCPTPNCGGKDRHRFYNSNGDGTFHCSHCGGGDGFKLLMLFRGWTFNQAVEFVASVLGISKEKDATTDIIITTTVPLLPVVNLTPDPDRLSKNNWIYSTSYSISFGCQVHGFECPTRLYLRSRLPSIKDYPATLRCHPGLNYGKPFGRYPAMVARINGRDGSMVGLHKTFLTQCGRKAEDANENTIPSIAVPNRMSKMQTKKLFDGATKGAAIRLYEPTDVLGIAEGIETAIAGHLAWDIPFWSAMSAWGMEHVEIPLVVQHVVVAADHDAKGKGLEAARKLASRVKLEGRSVQIFMAESLGLDIADIVKGAFKA